MNFLKVMPLFCLALFIDALQALVSMALSVVAAAPGTVGGCAVGAAVGGSAGCAIFGLLGTVLNVAAPLTEPIGIGLGIAISICLSFTLGSILVGLLKFSGMLDGKAAVFAFLGEGMPGFDVLPAWSGLVIYCAWKAAKQEKMNLALRAASAVSSKLVLPNNSIGNAMRQETAQRLTTRSRIDYNEMQDELAGALNTERPESANSRSLPMQDVKIRPPRADNDNVPQPYAQAA